MQVQLCLTSMRKRKERREANNKAKGIHMRERAGKKGKIISVEEKGGEAKGREEFIPEEIEG